MRVGSGVAVDDPDEAAGVVDDHVGVGIPFEERRQFLQAFAHFAADHHAAVGREVIGEQNIRLAFTNSGGEAHEER